MTSVTPVRGQRWGWCKTHPSVTTKRFYSGQNRVESKSLKRSALLLLRTPFQAWFAELALSAESIFDCEVIYFTQNDSTQDRNYYKKLSSNAI